jgi:hypothetical protein
MSNPSNAPGTTGTINRTPAVEVAPGAAPASLAACGTKCVEDIDPVGGILKPGDDLGRCRCGTNFGGLHQIGPSFRHGNTGGLQCFGS